MDLSPEQVNLAQRWCPNANIVTEDIETFLSQFKGHYALIGGFDIIEHFHKEEILPFLKLIFQSLRPGGRLILQTPNGDSPWMSPIGYGDFTHEWFFTPKSLANLLKIVGFIEFEVRPISPHIHGIKSLARAAVWRLINLLLKVYSVAETGSPGSQIYTRVFIASATRP